MIHDQWSLMGERNLGPINVEWASTVGPLVLMKAILNDYWADVRVWPDQDTWDRERIDIVMSKLYWCWVAEMDRQQSLKELE